MRKIVLFGDSILGGYRDGHLTDLITNGLKAAFPQTQINNYSLPGATTDDALSNVDSHVLALHPQVVVLAFGVNDASIHLGMSAGKYNNNLDHLVERLGEQKTVLVSPAYTNWRVARDQSWPRILQFELVAEHVAASHHLPFVNLGKAMRDTTHPNDLLQGDGIHFDDAGNQLLIDQLIPQINKVLTKK